MFLWVVLDAVSVDHDSFNGTLLTDEEDNLVLLSDGVDEEVCADVVHVGHKDGGVFRCSVRGVVIL